MLLLPPRSGSGAGLAPGSNSTHPDDYELEQLARSLSIDGSLGRHDTQLAAQALRRLARFESDRDMRNR